MSSTPRLNVNNLEQKLVKSSPCSALHTKYQTPGILEIHLDNVLSAAIHSTPFTAYTGQGLTFTHTYSHTEENKPTGNRKNYFMVR